MENNMMQIPEIPKEKFAFASAGQIIHDKKLETKSRGYFADAFIRFKKNKSSVVAGIIIGVLILFAIIAPMVSMYTIDQKDTKYQSFSPYIPSIAKLGIGIFDGDVRHESQNDAQMLYWEGIYRETGYQPLIKIQSETESTTLKKGKPITTKSYSILCNRYYETGVFIPGTITEEEFAAMQRWQDETGIQLIYPWVEKESIYSELDFDGRDKMTDEQIKAKVKTLIQDIQQSSIENLWYKVSSTKNVPLLDKNGDFIPAYATVDSGLGGDRYSYTSSRIAGDDGSYLYAKAVAGGYKVRLCYYNYYQYVNGHEPCFIFGTNSMGQDLFCGIGVGARFSLVFAVLVSAINLTIGAIYGAIEGYYGGAADMIMERISDILSGVPFIVVSTLFQLHLAQKVGIFVSFLFAFVSTGWIGMAALTRKQFYRFKSQEFVMSARTLGASDWRLMFKHIFPNSLGTIITSCALVIPGVISSETTLTYLGIVNLSDVFGTTIGVLSQQGQTAMMTAPHAMFFPALFISLLLVSFNLFGNGLRDAFNPSTRGMED